MDIGTLFSVIQTLLAALQCSQLKEVWSIWGYKSDLDELASIVATVNKVLLDAEAKYDELSQETLLYIEELRDALYDADDLLDEFATLAKQKMLMENDKFVKKVRLFFSRYNQVGVAYSMSHGVKKIVKKLDNIASRHNKYGLNLHTCSIPNHMPIRKRREETCSYADTEIIGRGEDVEKIVGILLDSHVERDVSFLSIVGMGGLGKTALAQLVYNHEKITKEFPLRVWTCVSDHDQSNLDIKTILAQILLSATGKMNDRYSLDMIVSRLRDALSQNRFLIVLDDLWTENRDELKRLIGHLVGGKGGRVVVTTRSKETAKLVGNGLTYELKGLSDEKSWLLFQHMAFEQVFDQVSSNNNVDFILIGKDIVRLCANVPLAIRVIGSFLYGQDKDKWLSVQTFGLANLKEDQNGIKPILKLSYHSLDSPLKSCFSYCALFPKDFEIRKTMLLSLWLAQGYVVPLANGQSIDDASEAYFLILLRRCFFQDVKKDEFGDIISFKLHDLMHDVALEVSQKEIRPTSSFTGEISKVMRHVSLNDKQYGSHYFTKAHIRTYINVDANFRGFAHTCTCVRCLEGLRTYTASLESRRTYTCNIVSLLANYRCLRALSLKFRSIKILPASIGKLIHLRYLDLSHNPDLETLSKSITKLHNLQTLNLSWCSSLKELPNDLGKLFNLKVLGLEGCSSLMFMPVGMMSKLTDLHTLDKYVVGKRSSSRLNLNVEIESLKGLKKLRGDLEIVIHVPKNGVFVREDTLREGAYLRDKERLRKITFDFKPESTIEEATNYEDELLGALQPHSNLKQLILNNYRARMPRWAEEDNLANFLPNLVYLRLEKCSELRCLASLGKLQHLKALTLRYLSNLEYIESHPTTSSSSEGLLFFPSLESLNLSGLPKLKELGGRSRETVGGDNSTSNLNIEPYQSSLILSQLKYLSITDCPDLISFLGCPNLESLELRGINEGLRIEPYQSNPTSLQIDNLSWLQHSSLPLEFFQSLTSLNLSHDEDIESLTEIGEVLHACSSSLRNLTIGSCRKLRSLSGGLQHLAALETLHLSNLPKVNLTDEEIGGGVEGDAMPWGSLCHYLYIDDCNEVHSFPKWMRKLSSLQKLSVHSCSETLYERCQNPNGEDWPNIQHIPDITIMSVNFSQPWIKQRLN